MSTITVGGLATGLDTNTIITKLIEIERQPVDLLQAKRDAAASTKSDIETLNTKLLALRSALDDLRDEDTFLAKSASSSDETVLTASASSSATASSTTITVSQLATTSVASSGTGVTALTSAVVSGTGKHLKFTVGSNPQTDLTLTDGETLQGLVDQINAANAGVTASAVNMGTSSSPDYRLQIVSDSTGASNDISIDLDQTSISITTTQNAVNAQFTVSGLSGTFNRESNVFSDVLSGVTITLKDTGSAVLTVNADSSAIASNVQAFVDAFNDIVSFIDSESTVSVTRDSEDRTEKVDLGPLAGDSTVERIDSRLHELVSGQVSGLSGALDTLALVGIKTERDGTLSFDQSKLTSELGTREADVAELFAGTSSTTGVADTLYTYVDGLTKTGGVMDKREQGLDSRISDLDDRIDDGERALETFEKDLRAQFTALETLVSGLQSQSSFLTAFLVGQG